MNIKTADLCDQHATDIQVVDPIFSDYGGARAFGGKIVTLKIFEDNVLVREALSEDGAGRVLVIDGGGSLRCALVGDQLAELAYAHDWSGIVVYGCIRDSEEIGQISIGVKALRTHPLRSVKRGEGQRAIPVTFAGVTFIPGHYLYADSDGIIVADSALL